MTRAIAAILVIVFAGAAHADIVAEPGDVATIELNGDGTVTASYGGKSYTVGVGTSGKPESE